MIMLRNVLSTLFITMILVFGGIKTDFSHNENQGYEAFQNVTGTDGEKNAPDFTLYTVNGEKIKLSDYSGKIVILDFWATWCPPCKRSIPDLISIQKEYEGKVVVIGISLDYPTMRNDLESFINEIEINYPVVIGTQDVVMDYGDIRAIPTTFIINGDGNIVNEFVGLIPKATLINGINSILKNLQQE